ncbi:MAG: pyridoxal phosphate-dependent aminotransferase [Caldilineaceae bacterium SB0664_bin_27]|uniref:Aminotransferase n=1 Tax=Caldilineaceae bacterium SB0664_bin_27 TaxID=2605260 RepID=A0A6B0YXC3_9CHLR|nr:pyridoxal phosphate-dependent aminotransferase [Caldilineaceae bacterium SB0664_bin_27]
MIREMTRLAMEHEAVNLSQGFPDFDPPEAIVQAAVDAIRGEANQYTVTWGYPLLRQALAGQYTAQLGWTVDPDVHICVVCGVTEGITTSLLALLNPGDELIILEPGHENFRPSALLADASAVPVVLEAPDYRIDADRLEAAVTPRTRALLLNTPHNPTGRVFDDEEMVAIAAFTNRHNLILITDEIYDRILYDGRQHVSPGSLDGLMERTVTIGGLGKSFAVTGWRLGYVIAREPLAGAIRAVHDYSTICAPTPLQAAAAVALSQPNDYWLQMREEYDERREVMLAMLREAGFRAVRPEGSYYTMADYTAIDAPQAEWDSHRFARWLTTEVGVASVAGINFYTRDREKYGEGIIRFAFAKRIETLHEAGRRLATIAP